MSPCYVPVFPVEIFEAIIDQASDNTAALRHLSLICHAFLPRARYQLFSSVVLHTPQRVELFTVFIDTHPWVRPLVQKLAHSNCLPVVDSDSGSSAVDILKIIPVDLLPKLFNLRTWRMGVPEDEGEVPWLQLGPSHSSALSLFPPSYSSHVRNLELTFAYFKYKSAFIGLVSAFTSIQTLTCSDVVIMSSRETGKALISPPQLRTLTVTMSVDIKGLEYLLNLSRNTLNELILTLNLIRAASYFETLQTLVGSLSRLRSLTLTIPSGSTSWRETDSEDDQLPKIRHATSLIRSITSVRGVQVGVAFKPGPIASLGACLASGAQATETCKVFEDALLIFPHSHIQFHDDSAIVRAGRVGFWSRIIKKAFPKLSEGGRLILPEPKSDAADLVGHEASVACLTVSSHGQCVVSGSEDGTIIVWDAERGTVSQEWYAHRDGVRYLALSPDGRRLVSLGRWGGTTPTVWDISNDVRQAARLEGHMQVVTTCAWSPDGTLIASTSMDGTVRIWEAQTFKQRDLVKDPEHALGYNHIQFSPNSRCLGAWMPLSVVPCDWRGCTIWSPLTRKQPKRFPPSPTDIGGNVSVRALSFDAEGRRLATAHGERSESSENVIRVWDIATGAALAELLGHSGILTDLSFSLDGRSLLSTSCNGFAKIQWDAKWNRRDTAFPADRGSALGVIGARFSPDGKYVATHTWGGTVQLWRTDYGSCAAVFTEHRARVMHVAFSSDSEWLASGDLDGVVHIRRLSHWLET